MRLPLQQRLTRLAAKPHLPRRTVRLRLTLLYGGLFLLSGAALLAITYVLVVHATNGFIFKGQNGGAAVTNFGSSHKQPRPAVAIQQRPKLSAGGPGATNLTPRQLEAQAAQLEAQARQQHASVLHQLLIQSGVALAVMALISIALGWIVAGRALRPLRTITAAARDISVTNLHERLALQGPDDELKELGDTFDELLARLDASFQAQRQFVANASHELRTPLARQRTLGQVALADPDATVASLRKAHQRVLAAGAEQERLIEALLTLARGQTGLGKQQHFDLATVTERVLLTQRLEAEQRDLELFATLRAAPASGDPRLIERLVTNILENAQRHNLPGGWVKIRTGTSAGQTVLSVSNTGEVVPAGAVDRLFEPFHRLAPDRTGHGQGAGLGLSIVRAIVDAHRATVTAEPRPEGGLRVDVSFPKPGSNGNWRDHR
jgi:signal transduction histidine kinase